MVLEDYVSFETAKLLKEKGFNEKVRTFYNDKTHKIQFIDNFINNQKPFNLCLLAPTHQMAMKWLREVHHIYIKISFRFCCNADDDIEYCYDVWKHTDKYVVGQHNSDGRFMSNEEAVEAALKYSLENLI